MSAVPILVFFYFLSGLRILADGDTQERTPVPYETQVEAAPDENFDYAAIQLWLPIVSEKVQGILCVILHPLGRGGSTLAHPGPWIELARQENCALISVSFAQSSDQTRDWCRADQGTGRALLASLDYLARQCGAPVLSTAPVIPVGVCAAGQFAFHLAAFAPDRVAAFITIGGGKHDLSKFKATSAIPALLVMTPDRGADSTENLKLLYNEGRTLSAPWHSASEPIAKYDAGLCSNKVISYLRGRLARLGDHAAVGADTAPSPSGDSDIWQRISICGMRLPPQVIIEPSSVALGTIDSSAGIKTFSFNIDAIANSTVTAVVAYTSNEAAQTTVRGSGTHKWILECRLDPNKLPLGAFKLDIKVRFLSENKLILGGEKEELRGVISGPVGWHPLSFDFRSVKAGKISTASIEIASLDEKPVEIGKVTSPYPWITVTKLEGLNNALITCVAQPPHDYLENGFAGYLCVEIKSPVHRVLKLFAFMEGRAKPHFEQQ